MGVRRGVVFVVSFVALGAAWVQPATAGRDPSAIGTDHRPPPRGSAEPLRTPKGMLPGIDVSHWQDRIDWARVANSGVRFAVMKATDGQHYIDPTFRYNAQHASANGIVVGAYHFADPSRHLSDAVAEADHFVAVVDPQVGDLIPALDIEHTNGLSVAELRAWVKAWLGEVVKRTGVHPMIYTSPYFWQTALGDWQWFSANGYGVLWIAHWRVSSPTVPANDWSGHGWTYWQWTDCVSVPGIANCVDGDRFNDTSLLAGEVARVQVTTSLAGTVTSDTGHISCDGTDGICSALTDPGAAVVLRADPDPDAMFVDWTGACAGQDTQCSVVSIGRVSTKAEFGFPVTAALAGTGSGAVTASRAGIDCGATCAGLAISGSQVTFTATPDSASGFDGWGGACAGTDPSCTVNVTGPTDVTARFDASVPIAADGVGTSFTWGRVAAARAMGSTYLLDRGEGASVSVAFSGGRVTWYSVDGPKGGIASVSVDGTPISSTSTYASSPRFGTGHDLDGFGSGAHVLTIAVSGRRSTRSSGTRVGVDAVRSSGHLRKSPSPVETTWSVVPASAGSDPTVRSDTAGATASLRFHGTGVSFETLLGPDMGCADVFVDGHLLRTFDLSASTAGTATRGVTGLNDEAHTVRVVVTGEHGNHGTGTGVAIAGWTVG
jgi:GH25 family lysozyme M1 (1,4-beta-N-acetylmuramidase)